jgi:hypothetical protein
MELKRQPPCPSTAGLEGTAVPTEVGWHCAVMLARDATALKMDALLTAFIAAALQGCLETHVVLQLSRVLARNQPDGRAHVLPSLVGEIYPSKQEQVRDEGVAQSPVHHVLTPQCFSHALAAQMKQVKKPTCD